MSQGAGAHHEWGEFGTDELGIVLDDLEGVLVTSFGTLADAVVEGIKGSLGMYEAARGKESADENGAVLAVIGTVARAKLNALARHRGVVIYEMLFFAIFALYTAVFQTNYRHLASMLLALDGRDSVLAGRKGGERILGGITEWEAFGESMFCVGGNLEGAIDGL